MTKTLFAFTLFIFSVAFAQAQDTTDFYNPTEAKKSEPKPPYNLREHIFTGGNFGLQFGTITLVDLSPLIGYKITPKFSAALGVTYTYLKDNRYNPAYSTNIYGARVIGRYFILENLFAHAEYEALNGEWIYNKRFTIYNVLAGGGYRQSITDHLFFDALLLWNFNKSIYSPYQNPIIRIGFNIGL